MPATSGFATAGFADPIGSPGAMPDDLAVDGIWYIDHLDHDTLSPYQTMQPENLHFVMNARDKSTIEYEISLSATMPISGSPVVSTEDFIHPQRTGWTLRYGSIVIMSGIHSSVYGKLGDDYMKVAGVDWMGYLDERMYPFDPRNGHQDDYVIGTPPQGLAAEYVDVDVSVIVGDLWEKIFSRPNSLPLNYSPSTVGFNVPYFRLDLGDTTTFLEILQNLADFAPGFDFWIDPVSRELMIAAPYRFGEINALLDAGEGGPNIIYDTSTSDASKPDSIEFTNTGPQYTHLLGTGSGLASELGVALGTVDAEAAFWRTDGNYDAGDVFSVDQLAGLTSQQLGWGEQPVHEIPLTVDPGRITDFWTKFFPGMALWINDDFQFHYINSAQRIVTMDCTVDTQGNQIVQLGVNQIYFDWNTDDTVPEGGDPGIPEA